jgi:N-carbamoylputrescine amidase
MKKKVKIALIQMRCYRDKAKSMASAVKFIEQAAKKGADIVCLPELFLTDYFCQTEDHTLFDLAENIPGPTTKTLSALAKRLGIVLLGSIFEKRAAGVYHNTLVVFEKDGKIADIYRKMHIPHDPRFYEKYYFTPGDLGFKAVPTSAAKVGTLVCWDQWYPEAARLTALKGAEIIFYPTAIGWHPEEKAAAGKEQADSWETIQRSHAIANGVFVAAANRIGYEGPKNHGIEFWGNSFITNPYGQIIAKASSDKEEVLIAECNLALIEEKRRFWPFLRDRRIDEYKGITKRFDV